MQPVDTTLVHPPAYTPLAGRGSSTVYPMQPIDLFGCDICEEDVSVTVIVAKRKGVGIRICHRCAVQAARLTE